MASSGQTSEKGYYANRKLHKYVDLSIGFLGTILIWYITFHPFWFIAPLVICLL